MFAVLVALALLQDGPAQIQFELSIPRPTTHLLHVRMTVFDAPGDSFDLAMPVWTPGSYKVRDYAQYVQDFEAGGLEFEKVDKTTWRIRHQGARKAQISYRIFAHEMSVRNCHVDSEHATVIGASTFLYVKGLEKMPHSVEIVPPPGWTIATGLDRAAADRFLAPDYDVLIDCPIEAGPLRAAEFSVRGVPHRVAVSGPCPVALEKIRDDLAKTVESAAALFGEIPYKHYTFIVRSLPGGGGGGLEHLNSTLMDVSTVRLGTEEGYRRFLELAAHEFIHTWLVKRLRPAELGPFDYTKENHTKLLWVMEGITSYYAPVALKRAGVWTERQVLEAFADTIETVLRTPGRKRESPEMASFNAWIHHYQRGPQSVNATTSYYDTGEIRGLVLDLEIRRRSGRSLDDVMKALYREATARGRGVSPEDFQLACEKAAGGSLEDLFARTIRGTEDPDLGPGLAHVGLALKNEGKPEPYLGAAFEGNAISAVIEGGPAWREGLCVGDELVAIRRIKAAAETWKDHVAPIRDGDKVPFTVFRRGILKEVEVTMERRAEPDLKLERVASPSAAQSAALEAWLGN